MNKIVLVKDFSNAFDQFSSAISSSHESDLEKAACIQYFEFCFELAWKSIKIIAEELGHEVNAPKSALKLAFLNKWISDEVLWLEMLNARNRMSHTYDTRQALSVYNQLQNFKIGFAELLKNLKNESGFSKAE